MFNYLLFSNFFQSSSSDGKFIPSQLYLFIKGLIFAIPCGPFLISWWFNATVKTYWKHLLSFLLTRFIVAFFYPIRRIYIWSTMILIYFMTFIIKYMNTIKYEIITSHWFSQSNLIFFISQSKSSLITSSDLSLIMISMLSLFECMTRSSSWSSFEEIKSIFIVNWTFHVSNFLRLFMISIV